MILLEDDQPRCSCARSSLNLGLTELVRDCSGPCTRRWNPEKVYLQRRALAVAAIKPMSACRWWGVGGTAAMGMPRVGLICGPHRGLASDRAVK